MPARPPMTTPARRPSPSRGVAARPGARPLAALQRRRARRPSADPARVAEPPSREATEPAPSRPRPTIGEVTGRLPQGRAARLVDQQVGDVVDRWFEAAYVGGDYPRNDFADCVARASPPARQAARAADRGLMSNQDIGARIDGVDGRPAQGRRVDLLAVSGARGRRHRPRAAQVPDRPARSSARSRSGAAVPHPARRTAGASSATTSRREPADATDRRPLRSGASAPVTLGRSCSRWPRSSSPTRRSSRPRSALVKINRAAGSTSAHGRRLDPRGRLRRPARRGHDPQPRRRAPAGRHEHPHRRRDRDRHPARLVGARSPATAPTRSTPPSTSAARSCMGDAVGNLVGIQPDYVFVTRFKFFEAMVDEHRRHRRRQPGRVQRPLPQARGLRRRAGSTSAATTRWLLPDPHNLIRGDFDRSANQQRVLRGIQAKVRARADEPGLHRARRHAVMQHLHTDLLAGRAVPARPGRRPGRPPSDHHLRRPGRHRQRRRRERGPPVRRPGPPPRRRRPERRDARALLTARVRCSSSTSRPSACAR